MEYAVFVGRRERDRLFGWLKCLLSVPFNQSTGGKFCDWSEEQENSRGNQYLCLELLFFEAIGIQLLERLNFKWYGERNDSALADTVVM